MFRTALIVAGTLAMLAGCRGDADISQDEQHRSTSAQTWRIGFVLSGGIAGRVRSLELSDEGRLLVLDKKLGVERIKRMPMDQLERIERLLAALQWDQSAANQRAFRQCADCVHYVLRVTSGGRELFVRGDSLGADDSPLAQLLKTLVTEMRAALE